MVSNKGGKSTRVASDAIHGEFEMEKKTKVIEWPPLRMARWLIRRFVGDNRNKQYVDVTDDEVDAAVRTVEGSDNVRDWHTVRITGIRLARKADNDKDDHTRYKIK